MIACGRGHIWFWSILGHKSSEYSNLNLANTQACEQTNRKLRKVLHIHEPRHVYAVAHSLPCLPKYFDIIVASAGWVQSHLVIPVICLSHNAPILFTIIDIIFSGRRSPAILCQEWERYSTWRGALDFSFNKRNIYFQWISPTWNAFLSVAFYEDLFDKKNFVERFFGEK